ncbi:hypothetical protein D3C83_28540 [compost metagenome]
MATISSRTGLPVQITAVASPKALGKVVSTRSASLASTRFASPAIEFCSWIANGRLRSEAIMPPGNET